MVKYWMTKSGGVYCGDRLSPSHVEIPTKPGVFYNWDGEKWVEDTKAKDDFESAEALEAMIKEEIRVIAIDSLKSKGKI